MRLSAAYREILGAAKPQNGRCAGESGILETDTRAAVLHVARHAVLRDLIETSEATTRWSLMTAKKTITADEFDCQIDAGESALEHLDWSSARRPDQ